MKRPTFWNVRINMQQTIDVSHFCKLQTTTNKNCWRWFPLWECEAVRCCPVRLPELQGSNSFPLWQSRGSMRGKVPARPWFRSPPGGCNSAPVAVGATNPYWGGRYSGVRPDLLSSTLLDGGGPELPPDLTPWRWSSTTPLPLHIAARASCQERKQCKVLCLGYRLCSAKVYVRRSTVVKAWWRLWMWFLPWKCQCAPALLLYVLQMKI